MKKSTGLRAQAFIVAVSLLSAAGLVGSGRGEGRQLSDVRVLCSR